MSVAVTASGVRVRFDLSCLAGIACVICWWPTFFDATLGFLAEGPRHQVSPDHDRPKANLAKRRIRFEASEKRSMLLGLFVDWLRDFFVVSLYDLLKEEGKTVAKYLALYGQHMYEWGDAVGSYVDTILSVVDQERSLRKMLTAAWDTAESWKLLMPWSNHVPTPPTVLLAMFSLSVIWDWPDMGLFILTAFCALLRPGEVMKLTRSDVLLPSDLMTTRRHAFIHLRDPKMRRILARRDHVCVEEPLLLELLEVWLPRLKPEQRLFPMKPENMRKYHNVLVTFFGIPAADGRGLTPASRRL